MRIDKIDLGHQSSGDREEIVYFQLLGTFFLTTREILTTQSIRPHGLEIAMILLFPFREQTQFPWLLGLHEHE